MSKLSKVLLGALVVVLVLLLAAAVGLRVLRGRHGTPVEVSSGVWGVESGGSWVYATAAGKGALLFDAGGDPEGRGIDALLAKLRLGHDDVTGIFITHGHFDHTAGAALFPRAQVHAGAADAEVIAGHEKPSALLPRLLASLAPVPPARVTQRLTSRMALIEPGDATVVAVPIPGHTPGSYAYLCRGVLFVGDSIVFRDGRLSASPGVFTADEGENRRSVVALAKLTEPLLYDVVCTGHGGCTPADGKRLLDAYAK